MSRDNELPYVLLDSDKTGKEYVKQLKNGTYKQQQEKVLEVADFLSDKAFEIEDLMPSKSFVDNIDRTYRGKTYFDDDFVDGEPIVDQVEKWAKGAGVDLQKGWKVDFARELINNFDRAMKTVPPELEEKWLSLFETLLKK